MEFWDCLVETAVSRLASKNLLRSTRPISLPPWSLDEEEGPLGDLETFDGPRHWDRSSVEVEVDEHTIREWLSELPSSGAQSVCKNDVAVRKMLLFSGNDYLGLSTHPSVRKITARAAQVYGMGPRGSALICGYTNHHKLLESSLAELKKKEDCLLCPTGFASNMAFLTALGSISSLLAINKKPCRHERIAIFSDALNHASIIDGIRLVERQQEAEIFVYKHGDMVHLNDLLLCCELEKKVVITDSLFSMDGDFAPIVQLVALRKKHKFLLAIDDAHATLVCGENGGGLPELYGCENDIDICIGTLSKAAGCQGGFIACSKKWRQLIQSRGRSFIFSTAPPVPIVAASHAALLVAKTEKWRRAAIWNRVQDFCALTGLKITSPIISLVIGSEKDALSASRHMLESGFHVTAIRPPTVPANSCRLRITLSAAHTPEDIEKLVAALSFWFVLPVVEQNGQMVSKL